MNCLLAGQTKYERNENKEDPHFLFDLELTYFGISFTRDIMVHELSITF